MALDLGPMFQEQDPSSSGEVGLGPKAAPVVTIQPLPRASLAACGKGPHSQLRNLRIGKGARRHSRTHRVCVTVPGEDVAFCR